MRTDDDDHDHDDAADNDYGDVDSLLAPLDHLQTVKISIMTTTTMMMIIMLMMIMTEHLYYLFI